MSAFANQVDLAAASLGGRIVTCSDEFFAPATSLLEPGRGVFIPDKYTDRGKWMDGWESRRRRVPGHDWCVIELGRPGRVRGLDIDTNHFLGNHPPFASVDACWAPSASAEDLLRERAWREILPQTGLRAGSQNVFGSEDPGPFTHVRLNIFPDGGVARLRVYGEPLPPEGDALIDLAALANGGGAIACNDMFFSPMANLTASGPAANMGEGWETRRRRDAGNDWIIVRLCAMGTIDELEIDTSYFKGNYPDRLAVDAICWRGAPPRSLLLSEDWTELVPRLKLRPDDRRRVSDLAARGPFTHVRLRTYPCGGVSRLRVYGRRAQAPTPGPLAGRVNAMSESEARELFSRCCGSQQWVAGMMAARPFASGAELLGVAESSWFNLSRWDWLEAFAHHPAIGADPDQLRARFAKTADLAEAEQAGVRDVPEATLVALAAANREYDERFGHRFIVCATGKSADEMLALLRERLHNAADAELHIAAGEQIQITRLRLKGAVRTS